MHRASISRISLVAFLLLCSLRPVEALYGLSAWGSRLSDVDPYSEANAIRIVRNFLDNGIGKDYGLGNVIYPGLYPDEGFAADPAGTADSVTPSGVYTHYPPGPEYLLYISALVQGTETLGRLRLLPILNAWAIIVFFGWSVYRRFGAAVAWPVMIACLALPTFSDAIPHLHAVGYSFYFFLLSIALALGRKTRFWAFLITGFIQGWITFDYAFLVMLMPVALEIALSRIEQSGGQRLRIGLLRGVAGAAGFTLAHLLHFFQVALFFGSLNGAFEDLAGAASHRSGASFGVIDRLVLTILMLDQYLRADGRHWFFQRAGDLTGTRFMGLALGYWWVLLTFGVLGLRSRAMAIGRSRLLEDWGIVSLCGLLPSMTWSVAMVNHGAVHTHTLHRHLFFFFFLMLLFSINVVRDIVCRGFVTTKNE